MSTSISPNSSTVLDENADEQRIVETHAFYPILMVAILYPGWSLFLHLFLPAELGDMLGCILVGLFGFGCFFFAKRFEAVRARVRWVSLLAVLVMTAHLYGLVYRSNLSDIYIFGATVVASVTSVMFDQLKPYVLQAAFSVGCATVLGLHFASTTNRGPMFIAMIVSIHVVIFFSYRARLTALKNLKDARLANLEMKRAFLEKELDQVRIESQSLKVISFQDQVTKLPNRFYFEKQLHLAIDRYHQENVPFTVLFIDLDKFKTVNDTLGHKAGDYTLEISAARIRSALRRADILARQGGDEFVAILSGVDNSQIVGTVRTKIRDTVTQPIQFNGSEYRIGASVGFAYCPGDGKTFEELLSKADMKMYEEKRARQLS